MPYEVPTVEQFVERFPQFANDDPYWLNAILTEAATQVDTNWIESDYQPAIMYLTAHLATVEKASIAAGSAGAANMPLGPIASESFGVMSRSYATPSGGGGSSSGDAQYQATIYGRRYVQLRNMNFPAIIVA